MIFSLFGSMRGGSVSVTRKREIRAAVGELLAVLLAVEHVADVAVAVLGELADGTPGRRRSSTPVTLPALSQLVQLRSQIEEQVGLAQLRVDGEREDLAGLLADEEAVACRGAVVSSSGFLNVSLGKARSIL